MNRIIKGTAAVLLIAALVLSGGCWSQRELKNLHITIGVGIDKDEKHAGYVKLIAQIVNPESMQSGTESSGGGQLAYINHVSSGSNTFDAMREFTHEISERLYQAHTQVLVIGSEVAQDGIKTYLDFFIRAIETRPTTKIVIAQDTAFDVLCVEPDMEKLPAIQVNKLVESQEFNSQSKPAIIQEYISAMVSKTFAFTAPIVRIDKTDNEEKLMISGMAVFKQDRMVGELNEEESRGFLWVDGKIKSGVINVNVDEGEAAIEIKAASSKVSVKLEGETPVVDVKIDMQGVMATQTCQRNLATMEGIAEMESLTEQAVINEVSMSLSKARELNADIFGFGEEFHKYHNKRWKQMEENWHELFPELVVNLEVKAKVIATGVIIKPAQPEEGQK